MLRTMKNIIIAITVLGSFMSFSQSGPTFTENHVYKTTYQDGYEVNQLPTVPEIDKIETITYFDGLGRPKQSVAKQAGGNKEDIITPVYYDNFGRQTQQYLPYANLSTTSSSLAYRDNQSLKTSINEYYTVKYPDDISTIIPNPFSETQFEESPLNRVLRQGAPGKDWSINTEQVVETDYKTNNELEVAFFEVVHPGGDTEKIELVANGFYAPNKLYKTTTKDENFHATGHAAANEATMAEFTDKQGRVILKRVYNSKIDSATGITTEETNDTHYVYDDFGNLTYVIPPKAVDVLVKEQASFTQSISFTDIVNTAQAANGSGIINLTVDQPNDYIYIEIALEFSQDTTLKTGAVAALTSPTPDIVFGVLNSGTGGDDYEIAIENNNLVINSLNANAIMPAGQTYEEFDSRPIPPTINNSVINKLCYQYKYDYRNRLISKRIPGKQWEHIVYDILDRPIFTQDANLKAQGKWLFTKYDAFDRVVYTGLYTSSKSRKRLQNIATASTEVYEERIATRVLDRGLYSNNVITTDVENVEVLTINYYDDYENWFPPYAPSNNPILQQTISYNTNSLATGSEIKVLDTNQWIRSAVYYDEKSRPILNTMDNQYLQYYDIVKTKFDFVGNVIQVESDHAKRINDNCDDIVTFTARCAVHYEHVVTVDDYTYDHQNRLKTHVQTFKDDIYNNIQEPQLIVDNTYDEIGQLVNKKVGGKESATNTLQDIDYTYNIRGWLRGINDIETTLTDDLFAFKINYNTVTTNAAGTFSKLNASRLFNGNISETLWKTANDNKKRGYGYQYDKLNRITKARYKAGNNLNEEAGFFDLKTVSYDKNGNILRLRRFTPTDDFLNREITDKLNYNYFGNSNQLKKVKDASNSTIDHGFTDVDQIGVNDYEYDDNGNLIKDLNKNISNITYNHLNLPKTVVVSLAGNKVPQSGDNRIEYVYNAAGVKMEKRVENIGFTISGNATEYAGNYIYKRVIAGAINNPSVLEFFSHPEGYVEPRFGAAPAAGVDPVIIGFDYVYQFKDHLGNIRLSYSDSDGNGSINPATEIIEENNYYPFGLQHKGYNNVVNGTEHNYKTFQGQEINNELNLNWISFKYRNYDPAIGRFISIDPLAEDYVYNGTYNFAENKVISHLELEGLEGIHSSKVNGAGIRTHVIQKNVVVLTQAPRPVNAGASPKRAARIQRQNARIASSNVAKVNRVKSELKNAFSGARNSAGESVDFQFNVTALETDNTKGGSTRDVVNIGLANGVESGEAPFAGADNSVAPAAVVTTDSSGSSLGLTEGNVKISTNSSDSGVLAHEVGHTLMTGAKKEDDYPNGNGGLMDSPAGHVNSREVDRIIENSYEKKK